MTIPSPLLVIGRRERALIERLKAAAAAAPLGLADTALLLARRRAGADIGDAAAWTARLRFGWLVSYRVEDWPDGRWQRLSIRAPGADRPAIGAVAALISEFGFSATRLCDGVVWRGRLGNAAVLNIAERLGPLPAAAEVRAPPDEPLAAPEPGEFVPDDEAIEEDA